MMRLYAAAAGFESAQAEKESREWNIRRALSKFVQLALPSLDPVQADQFAISEVEKFQEKEDLALIEQHLASKNVAPEQIRDAISLADKIVDRNNNGLLVRAVIAGMIEKRFSKTDKGEYFIEIYRGNAK